jgi:hypothetical protein
MATARRRAGELLLAARVFAFAVCVPLITRLSLTRQAALLEPRGRRPPDPEREAWLEANVDRVLGRGAPLVRPGCQTRGLTYFYFLRRAGADVRLVYGIEATGSERDGHCWLVRDGRPYLERNDPRGRFLETHSVPRVAA